MVEPVRFQRRVQAMLLCAPIVLFSSCGSDAGITAASVDPASTVPTPVVFRLDIAGDCFRLVERTDTSPPEMSCPSTTGETPILLYEARPSGETSGAVFRFGDGYRLDSIRFAPDLRLEIVEGGWILAEGLAYGTSVARVMNDTETLDCVLNLVVDCTPVETAS